MKTGHKHCHIVKTFPGHFEILVSKIVSTIIRNELTHRATLNVF